MSTELYWIVGVEFTDTDSSLRRVVLPLTAAAQ